MHPFLGSVIVLTWNGLVVSYIRERKFHGALEVNKLLKHKKSLFQFNALNRNSDGCVTTNS